MRESGILYPIFSLPSKFGIGSLSKEAYEFVDFLHKAGQGYWQILPIGPTGFGDSPYQPVSVFAGNPYFVSPEELINEGLLTWDECHSFDFGNDEEKVDYGALYNNRNSLLKIAYQRFQESQESSSEYKAFLKKEAYWLEDYALFMALKMAHNGAGWRDWEDDLKLKNPTAINNAKKEYADEINFYCFVQYKFDQQWKKLHAYAKEKDVKIIGDIPFYASLDSVDVWSHPEAFLMNKKMNPTVVAGCAPDAFSPTGQLWGNPIYDWKTLKENDYDWWMSKIARALEFYDVVRIDHFHGFCNYYAIPYGDETAENGKNKKGPGADFWNMFEKKFGKLSEDNMRVIAEDLGTVTKENTKLLNDFNIPGMKIVQYAFTSWDSIYMPYKHIQNCVVYTGTHDNPTTRSWLETITDGERAFVRRYVNSSSDDYGAITWDLIRECYKSVANLCIIPIQDYLVKGSEARINVPGSAQGNWTWRVQPNFLSQELATSIRDVVALAGRMPKSQSLSL